MNRKFRDLDTFRISSVVNLLVLVGWLLFFRGFDRIEEGEWGVSATGWAWVYHVGQAIYLWGAAIVVSGVLYICGVPLLVLKILFALYFTLLGLYLYVDLVTFSLYQAHLEGSLFTVLFEPDIVRDLAVNAGVVMPVILGIVGFLALQLFMLSGVASRMVPSGLRDLCRPLRFGKMAGVACTLVILFFLLWSFQRHNDPRQAKRDAALLPLFAFGADFRPLAGLWTALGFEYVPTDDPDYFAGIAEKEISTSMETRGYRAFRESYTLPDTVVAENKFDVLVIAAESWRWDTVTPDIMPRLSSFIRDKAWMSPAHFATGTTTPEGLYGVFSGNDAMFWYAAMRGRYYPLFFKVLKKLGYQNAAISSSSFEFKDMHRYIFGPGIDEMFVINEMKKAEETIVWKRRPLEREDRAMLDEWIGRLDDPDRAQRPSMDFLFFYVTHYNYYYPEEFERFTPAMTSNFSANDLSLRGKTEQLYNRYLNSVHYLDHLLGEAIEALESRGRLDKTIIVITSDHGEEFFERGRFSHSMAVHNYQTRVPLILHIPGRPAVLDSFNVTSHADIVPTILSALGVDLPLTELFTGNSLMDRSTSPGQAIVSTQKTKHVPMEWAIVDGKGNEKFHFENLADSVHITRRVSMDDEPLPQAGETRIEEIRQLLIQRKAHYLPDQSRTSE